MEKIAIIGTGIAGNSAAWLLHRDFDITVFEAADYIGGHSNTVSVEGIPDVDTGFIVYNEWTYPNLIALFDHLNVETQATDMSFAVSMDQGGLEYSGDHIFAQKSNLFKPKFYAMLRDLLRFYKTAPNVLNDKAGADMSLGDYLKTHHYSDSFINWHILPMAAAIWSTSADDVREFPVQSFVQFFVNHGLFRLANRPQWHTVKGGSKEYVAKLTEGFKDKIRLNCAVRSVRREADHVVIEDASGQKSNFDHVVFACHSDQALALLKDADETENTVLGCFPYSENTAYLHLDETLMPKRRKAWSSWNYLTSSSKSGVSLSYWMNRLQPFIGKAQDVFVTLNPETPPASEKILKTIIYHHPQYTLEALKGWEKIKTIQGKNKAWFCGAWCGYGFHEDGITSGLAVAEKLSRALGKPVKRPWNIKDKSPAGRHVTG